MRGPERMAITQRAKTTSTHWRQPRLDAMQKRRSRLTLNLLPSLIPPSNPSKNAQEKQTEGQPPLGPYPQSEL